MARTKARVAKATTTRRKAPKKMTTRKAATKKTVKRASSAKAAPKAAGKAKTAAKKATAKKAPKAKASAQARLAIGMQVPEFFCEATSGKRISSKDLHGKKVVLYFYPKDSTPGCTLEGQDFKRLYREFQAAGCEIVGVSRDSVKSHENFKGKCGFPFELLADEDKHLCRLFDVIQMKSLYGRKFEGIERSTFVLDENGVLKAEWRKVKVPGHAETVLECVKKLD